MRALLVLALGVWMVDYGIDMTLLTVLQIVQALANWSALAAIKELPALSCVLSRGRASASVLVLVNCSQSKAYIALMGEITLDDCYCVDDRSFRSCLNVEKGRYWALRTRREETRAK